MIEVLIEHFYHFPTAGKKNPVHWNESEGRPVGDWQQAKRIIANCCNYTSIDFMSYKKSTKKTVKISNFQILLEFSVAQPTSRFPRFLDHNDVPERKRLIGQTPRLKCKTSRSCLIQQLILHIPDLENMREQCSKVTLFKDCVFKIQST